MPKIVTRFRVLAWQLGASKKRPPKYGSVNNINPIYSGLEIRDFAKNFSEWTVNIFLIMFFCFGILSLVIYIKRLFLFIVVFGFVLLGARQVYAACDPAECSPILGSCQQNNWGPEYQCLAKCCVIPAGGGGGSPTPAPPPGYEYHSCPAGTALSCGTSAQAQG